MIIPLTLPFPLFHIFYHLPSSLSLKHAITPSDTHALRLSPVRGWEVLSVQPASVQQREQQGVLWSRDLRVREVQMQARLRGAVLRVRG